jgi:hypothetical protein
VLDAIARMLDPKAAPPIPFPAFDPARFAAVIDEVAGFA